MIEHVVWDWNGTLLDDFEITAEASAIMIRLAGRSDVTYDDIRASHTRPFSDFFRMLVGRDPTEDEMGASLRRYIDMYEPIKRELPLASDALQSLSLLRDHGIGQSILSMAPDEELNELVGLRGIRDYFRRVDGATVLGQEKKVESLRRHVDALGCVPGRVALVGDTVDDFLAADALGIRAVLVTTGMNARQRLLATGAPVTDTLLAAAQAITELAGRKAALQGGS